MAQSCNAKKSWIANCFCYLVDFGLHLDLRKISTNFCYSQALTYDQTAWLAPQKNRTLLMLPFAVVSRHLNGRTTRPGIWGLIGLIRWMWQTDISQPALLSSVPAVNSAKHRQPRSCRPSQAGKRCIPHSWIHLIHKDRFINSLVSLDSLNSSKEPSRMASTPPLREILVTRSS